MPIAMDTAAMVGMERPMLASAEPVECMAEAALALCEPADPMITGRILYSKPFLEELGRGVRTLDGAAVHAP